MDEKILTQIRFLKKYIDLLKGISSRNIEAYMEDDILKGATQRYLQLAIETCINIGNRVISIEQMEKNIKVPETYAEVFDGLVSLELIKGDFANELKKMARFRNRLVHLYWEIDDNYIYEILKTRLEDFEKYLKFAVEYVSKK